MIVNRGVQAVAVTLLICTAGAASAGGIYTEVGDTGELLSTAAHVPVGTTKIVGSLYGYPDVDLYRFQLPAAAQVTFSVQLTGEWFDDDMTLFNANGNPLAVSDFAFTRTLGKGAYYFGLSDWDIAATNSSGTMIADDYEGILLSNEVLGGWLVTSSPFRSGPYEINLAMEKVPEPNVLALSLAGWLLGSAICRWRRAGRNQSTAHPGDANAPARIASIQKPT